MENALPEIAKARHVEVARKSAAPFLEDSGLELKGSSLLLSRPSTASTAGSSALGLGCRITPSPPPGARGAARSRPLTSTTGARKSLDYVWVSKSELERTEEALNSLKSKAVQSQAELRSLQHHKQDLALLQSGCVLMAEALGCSVEGVPPNAIKDILLTRVTHLMKEQQQATEQHAKCQRELERCRSEVAAGSSRLSSTETQLKQSTKAKECLSSDLKQAKREVESLRLTCARTGATVELLRQQLSEEQGKAGRNRKEASSELTCLQSDLGRLKKELIEKDDLVTSWKEQFDAVEAERGGLVERLADSEALHAELCVQLGAILQLDSTASFDLDHLLSQVSVVVEECEDMRLRCETLGNATKTADLDAKASRETILRLVSEAKKHEGVTQKLSRSESEREGQRAEVEGQKVSLLRFEQENACAYEQLASAKETVVALQQELEGKEERLSELHRSLAVCRLASDSNRSLVNSVQSDREALVTSLAAVLSSQSTDAGVLLQAVEEIKQRCSQQREELHSQCRVLEERGVSMETLRASSQRLEQGLAEERARAKRLEGEVVGLEVVRDGLSRDLDKCHTFSRKVTRVLALDRGTAQILATGGDFAHDAILLKAEQLVKLEGEALLSKQTALYSQQRKLKACRQALQSKDLHMSLLQRRAESLEQSLKASSHQKMEWEGAVAKMKKMEKQLDKLHGKVGEQQATISQLESESSQLHGLKEYCRQLEVERTHLRGNQKELEQTCAQQSQLLTEVRQRAKQKLQRDAEETKTSSAELAACRVEMERLKEEGGKLCVFKTTVQSLLLTQQELAEDSALKDFDLLAALERLIGSQKKHRDNARCLEASLRQLEQGFKTSYKDTLTLLSSADAE